MVNFWVMVMQVNELCLGTRGIVKISIPTDSHY